MKKLFISLSVLFVCVFAYGQSKEVPLPMKPKHRTSYVDYSTMDSGYWMAVEAGVGATVMFNRSNAAFSTVSAVGGYRLSEYFKIGLGVGARYFAKNGMRLDDIRWTFPVFANIRGNFLSQQDRGAVPYWSLNLGGEIRGGLYFSPTLGYRFGMNRNSFILGISYELITMDTIHKNKESQSALAIKVGYEF